MPQDTTPYLHTRIEPALMKRLKKQAAKEKRTIRSLVELALGKYLRIDRAESN